MKTTFLIQLDDVAPASASSIVFRDIHVMVLFTVKGLNSTANTEEWQEAELLLVNY